MTEIWCLLSLGEVKNSCSLSALFCIRIVTTSPLLSSRLPLSTNQLQFFWETFQPMQINIVLQCMWLHTTEKKKNPTSFFFWLWLCQSHVPSLCLKHLSYLCPCMGHYFWTQPWCLYPLLPFKTCISHNHGGRRIFVAAGLFTSLSYHMTVKYCSCSLISLCADPYFAWIWMINLSGQQTIHNFLKAIGMYMVL